MIPYHGHDILIKNAFLQGQGHVFDHWNTLSEEERRDLLEDLSTVDFELLNRLYRTAKGPGVYHGDFGPAPFIALPCHGGDAAEFEEARKAGEAHIREGRVAAFVVAGGQGTRLGYDGPKGAYGLGPVSGKSLFQIHAEKIVKYSKKYGVRIPLLIMTSPDNHDATVKFFQGRGNFGLDDRNLLVFPQSMIPSLDGDGKLILENRTRLFKNPDGHGGSLKALRTSGVLEELEERGIETISYFQVDNPLVKIIDPVFIGFHVLRDADVSNKGLEKTGPGEKMGVFVLFDNGRMGVVEYSDLPEGKAAETGPEGKLRFLMGSPAIHLFRRSFVEEITSGPSRGLPFHVARKKIKAWRGGEAGEIEGLKFEMFVFDALPLTAKSIILEMVREDEFAPVKNPDGVDSVESARRMMSELALKWLRERDIPVPPSVKLLEISPLLAVGPEDLGEVCVPNCEKAYLE